MAISQKLHTKLVQKLILTPSLQQAIKLLPMSTLELSELLNQEMVENPMLEEVPTEELQPVEATQEKAEEKKPPRRKRTPGTIRTTSTSSGTTSTTATGRARRLKSRNSRPSKTRSRRPRRSRITCSGSCRCRPTIRRCARSARRSSATSTTTGIWSPRSRSYRRWDRGRPKRSRSALRLVQGFDPIGVAVARSAGMSAAAAAEYRRHDRLAGRAHRHRAHAAAAEPSGAGAGAQARHVDRRPQAAHRADSAPRSEAGQPLQPVAVAVRHPGRVRREGRGSVRGRCSTKKGCRSCASARSTGGCSTRAPSRTPTRPAPM